MVVSLSCILIKSKCSFSIFPLRMYQSEIARVLWTLKSCGGKPNWFAGIVQNRHFCDKPYEADAGGTTSSAMDNLVKNLQKRVNLSDSSKKKLVTNGPSDYQPVQAVVTRRKLLPRAYNENVECDALLRNMVKSEDICPTKIVEVLQNLATKDKYPSRNVLVMIAGACASKGYIDGVRAVSDVCEIACPEEVICQMNYRHYEAEAHWKRGNYEQALKIFKDLFEIHPLQRRKIVNMSTFLMRHVVNSQMKELYPKLLAFVEFFFNYKEVVPAANLWKVAFCSESYDANCFAEQLLAKHREMVLPNVGEKVLSILGEAQSFKQIDVLQRLMQFVLSYELTEHYSVVFGTYMDYTCDANDIERALEAFYYISQSAIIIPTESMRKFQALLILNKKRPKISMPKINLNKSDTAKPVSTDFKF